MPELLEDSLVGDMGFNMVDIIPDVCMVYIKYPLESMGLAYLPTFTIKKSTINVKVNIPYMDPMGIGIYFQKYNFRPQKKMTKCLDTSD